MSAYAFLFDSSVDGLPDPQLPFFTASVLNGLAAADPHGTTRAQFRLGLPSLTAFSARTSAVHSSKTSSGHTVSYDLDTYKVVVMQWLDALDGGWNSIERAWAEKTLLRHTTECVALSDLSSDVRDRLDATLRKVPGYIGGFLIDPGNPLHWNGFFNLLIYGAAIFNGTVVQERTIDGYQEWALDGAAQFQPGGIVWKDYGWLTSHGPKGLPSVELSERGAAIVSMLTRKRAPSVEQRVIDALFRLSFLNSERKDFDFKTIGSGDNILEAIMPEGKFTKYLFDRSHKDGRSKANFIIGTLGIDPEDWRYLAAQFYLGLMSAQPEAVKLNEWKDGYGARFDVTMRVRGRSGSTGVLVTGWNMNPGALPSLSTAFPGSRISEAVEPTDVPVLPPGKRTNADWAKLWKWANDAGLQSAEVAVPTPMYLVGYDPIGEGDCGSALVRVADARRGLARWLLRFGPGQKDSCAGAVVFSPTVGQSLDRAAAWARAVALVLHLNGINAKVENLIS